MGNERRQKRCLCQKYVDQISRNAQLEEEALDSYAADRNVNMFDALYGGLDLKIHTLSRGPIRRLPKAITGK